MKHAPQIETDFTASLIENGVPALDSEFRRVLSGHRISVAIRAAYIHQSPMVSILDSVPRPMHTRKCELGDILLVQSHKRNPRKTYWRAALWQLKSNNGSIQRAKDPQFWLYEKWPIFDIYRGGLRRGKRDFKGDRRSGYYGLVSNSDWLICPPDASIDPKSPQMIDAARFLVEMMYAVDPSQAERNPDRGRRIFTRPHKSPSLNWSETIWELLNITAAKDFSARKLYEGRRPRLALIYNSDGAIPPHRTLQAPPVDGDGRGLAVIHLAVDATNFNPDQAEILG